MGKRKIITAGNDAHGNFNAFRQIKIPFLSMHEHRNQIYGQSRTALYVEGEFGAESILQSARDGRAVITTGPLAEIVFKDDSGDEYFIGDSVVSAKGELLVTAVSSEEFGSLDRVVIFKGDFEEGKEEPFALFEDIKGSYRFETSIEIDFKEPCYIRMEVYSEESDASFCISNPIWLGED